MFSQQYQRLTVEARWLLALISISVMIELINSAWHITVAGALSISWRVLNSSTWPPGLMAGAMIASALLVLPHVLSVVFDRPNRNVTKLGIAGTALGGICWVVMAYITTGAAGTGTVGMSIAYFARGVLSISIATALAIMLNNGRRRELREAQRHEISQYYSSH